MTSDSEDAHSAAYFGAGRDFWWNPDFLELTVQRLDLKATSSVLDLGCGLGHWSRELASALPRLETVVGVDAEWTWAKQASLPGPVGVTAQAKAENLPFRDASFDLVTCQTVLIHVADPASVLKEMCRITRPGGTVLVAEPNNRASMVVRTSSDAGWSLEKVLGRLSFYLTCEAGKAALGQGDSSVGDLLPQYFSNAGLVDLVVYLSDKASPLIPPFGSFEQQSLVEGIQIEVTAERWVWSREQAEAYFAAGGGDPKAFASRWASVLEDQRDELRAAQENTLSTAGGSLMYLIAGRVPSL